MQDPNEYNYFSQIPLSAEEQHSGTILSSLQKSVIQNLISTYANAMLRVETDLEHPLKSEIERAYLRGYIDSLKYLLDSNLPEENPQ